VETLEPVCEKDTLIEMKKACENVFVHEVILDYILDMTEKTRQHKGISLGVSPRGSLAFLKVAKCLSALRGENYVTPETVKYLAPYVLGHRLVLEDMYSSSRKAADYIQEIAAFTTVPTEDFSK
jgi:MoxR-like ATPase